MAGAGVLDAHRGASPSPRGGSDGPSWCRLYARGQSQDSNPELSGSKGSVSCPDPSLEAPGPWVPTG